MLSPYGESGRSAIKPLHGWNDAAGRRDAAVNCGNILAFDRKERIMIATVKIIRAALKS
ncbi:hypothetical protein [Sphingobium sp.]|uniref:hypothetical protein n=1 Tax=Sphingobium sp. TaxID=1912891 RepID=UPI002613DCA3|nr:hypothetical protein [Sphingobium sp.]